MFLLSSWKHWNQTEYDVQMTGGRGAASVGQATLHCGILADPHCEDTFVKIHGLIGAGALAGANCEIHQLVTMRFFSACAL